MPFVAWVAARATRSLSARAPQLVTWDRGDEPSTIRYRRTKQRAEAI